MGSFDLSLVEIVDDVVVQRLLELPVSVGDGVTVAF